MKVFLFAGSNYYPAGGWKDFKGSFDSVDLAKKHVAEHLQRYNDWMDGDVVYSDDLIISWDWYDITDNDMNLIVKDTYIR